jgi:hypothetical protein
MSDRAVLRHAPADYPFPTSQESLFPWSRAVEQLERARNHWLATSRTTGRPRIAPLWGAWTDAAFCAQGAQWARNLPASSAASMQLESGVNVVIVVGMDRNRSHLTAPLHTNDVRREAHFSHRLPHRSRSPSDLGVAPRGCEFWLRPHLIVLLSCWNGQQRTVASPERRAPLTRESELTHEQLHN